MRGLGILLCLSPTIPLWRHLSTFLFILGPTCATLGTKTGCLSYSLGGSEPCAMHWYLLGAMEESGWGRRLWVDGEVFCR